MKTKIRHLDLFSGIGGFALAAQWMGWETAAFCEKDLYCQKLLGQNFPDTPIYDDIRTIPSIGGIDLITGGFPCQPFSVAGVQKGKADDRYLWPSMLKVITQEKPTWVVGENVTGIIGLALDQVLADLEAEGYACQSFVLPACAVNAPHRRDRVWIVAYSNSKRRCSRNSDGENAENVGQPSRHTGNNSSGVESWNTEPSVGRVANGVSNRMDRIKGLGNAIVPQVVYTIFKNLNL